MIYKLTAEARTIQEVNPIELNIVINIIHIYIYKINFTIICKKTLLYL